MSRVYSPSQTKDWGFCPLYWWLRREEWSPSRVGFKEAAAIVGIGFAAGVASYNHLRIASGDRPDSDMYPAVVATGQEIASYHVEALKATHTWDDKFDPTSILTDVEAALYYYIENDPFDPSWKLLDAELTLPDHGNARLDLGVETPDGVLAVVDYKVKMSLQARYYDKEVNKYMWDHQQYHYAWGYGEVKQRPVERYYIALLVLRPQKSLKLHPFTVDPVALQDWLHFTRNAWDTMEIQRDHPELLTRNPDHENKYGPCPMRDACLLHKLDPNLMVAKDYRQIKREPIIDAPET